MSKLILGTAQFGSDYGIKHDGQPSVQEIEKIARVAWDGGIREIHMSWQYNIPKICDAIFDGFIKIEKEQDPLWITWKMWRGRIFYNPSEIDDNYKMMMIPVNVLDNRFLNRNLWNDSYIFARSVFLQGLLLMTDLPDWLPAIPRLMIRSFHLLSKAEGKEYYEAALGWVLGLDEIDKVIVGVNSAQQLEQLLAVKPFKWNFDFSIDDENVLDPRRWPK